jgi:hypothetical protein
VDKYKEYVKCQESDKATSEQKYAIEKYIYRKVWGIETVNSEFMDKWFRKTYVLCNLKFLTGVNVVKKVGNMFKKNDVKNKKNNNMNDDEFIIIDQNNKNVY